MTTQKMKIAMFGHKRIPGREGGAEIVVEELSSRIARLGHEVTVYNRGGHHVSGIEYDGYNKSASLNEYKGVQLRTVFTVDKKGIAAMTSSVSAALASTLGDYDVVHIHAEGPAAMAWLPKIRNKKVVVTIHGLDWQRAKWGNFASKYIKWGEQQAVKYADEIIVLSRGVQEYFENNYGRKTVFIPNGVTRPKIVDADEITEKWGLLKDSYVLFLGRIVPEKGVGYLIDAWKCINTDKKLVIAGGSSDTEQFLNEIKEKASDNVLFTGFQQGRVLEELYSNAYIYVLPSDLEGMPLSLLEAMSYGNCCVVSDIPECVDVVESYAASFQKGNVDDLVRVLQYLLDNRTRVDSYKRNSADYICKKYSWDDVVDKTIDIYHGSQEKKTCPI